MASLKRPIGHRTCRLVSWCAMIVFAVVALTSAPQLAARQRSEGAQVYDIPAQHLDSALDRYIRVSGMQVLYEAITTAKRRSAPVNGRFTPEAALTTLLGGTGLTAVRTDFNAFIIVRPSPENPGIGNGTPPRPSTQFLAALQRGVLDALCRNTSTRPGDYRLAIELWISQTGAIERSALIGSTGNLARDEMLVAALRGAKIGMAPPANVPQPLVLTIAQRSPRQTGDCGA
ncbi:secretin and TonB N-terminal domain-containing protein [Hyphomicrobium sp. CS1BSMeth3]|uniref:secretin and TonB N-terminal domain-containing protein n=1 Tax=Hyphomicrobium sp. CS1BSMeth3 TaxID=1892844 RepID=UPI0011608304|nr:secretin and TonB N-terminal domain-containing protein [Hyphomicrobium sp. CS1BSMeth3]